jgi:multidrug transporter EmrE-like cation transporter
MRSNAHLLLPSADTSRLNEALTPGGDNPVIAARTGVPVLNSLPILLCVLAISVGQVLFKLAAVRVETTDSRALAVSLLLNPPLLTALAVYGLATLAWVWLLRDRSLSASYPLFGLSFVMVAVMGRLFLGESLSLPVLAGTSLVVAGVVVITAFQ